MPHRVPRLTAQIVCIVALALSLLAVGACGSAAPAPASTAAPPVAEIATPSPGGGLLVAGGEAVPLEDDDPEDGTDGGPLPVTRLDPTWGSRLAPVTIVVFGDFECPFCARAAATVAALMTEYGPERLRVAWKHLPLPFHRQARPVAEEATAVFALRGSAAFFAYHDAMFLGGGRIGPGMRESAMAAARVDPAAVQRVVDGGAPADKVEADLELAAAVGATGTPAFFINGRKLSGAQPAARFQELIDMELGAARRLRDERVEARAIYAELSRRNFEQPAPRGALPSASPPPPDTTTVHRVPVGGSAVRGKATALVTLVVFSEFQCPFCARVEPTFDALAARYGDDLRIVWKHLPLPFHPRAVPAANLALEARAQKGDAAFFQATALLFATQRQLEDADLEGVARTLRLDVRRAMSAVATEKHKAAIEADKALAALVGARGTPTSFVNGRRLTGAQPEQIFAALIDEEIATAKALVAKGTPRAKVYEALQKSAVAPETP